MAVRKVPHRRRLAIEDIAGHSSHIAESNLDAALRFLDAIEATVELLCQFPEAGGTVPTARPEAEGLRAKLLNGFGHFKTPDFAARLHRMVRRQGSVKTVDASSIFLPTEIL